MGRRALPRIDPSLDLSRHFLAEDSLPVPLNSSAVFGREAPLEIEVGSGKGLFLVTASGERPNHDFLGVEISRKYARFAAARLARAGRENAVSVHGDAVRVVREVLSDGCVAAVHIYFPDPWWKKRHHKRRVVTESFVDSVRRVLQPGGRLHFWSDVQEYYRATLDLIGQNSGFEGPYQVEERPAEHDLDYRTNFERRMRKHGAAVYRAEFRRIPERGRIH
jgi:tRNA (guanine-N7-)-methyltransferase